MKIAGKHILAHFGKLLIVRNSSNRTDCFTLGGINYQLNDCTLGKDVGRKLQ